MTRIGSIFALVLVALLASFALVDAGLPPALAGGGGIVEATPLDPPVVLPSESSKAPRSHERDPAAVDRPSAATPLDDEEKAPTDASGAVGAYTLRDESTPTQREPKATSAHRPADGLRDDDDDDDGADPKTAATPAVSTRPNDPAGPADADADYDADDEKRQTRATIDAADERETRGDAAEVTHETRSSSSSLDDVEMDQYDIQVESDDDEDCETRRAQREGARARQEAADFLKTERDRNRADREAALRQHVTDAKKARIAEHPARDAPRRDVNTNHWRVESDAQPRKLPQQHARHTHSWWLCAG